MYSDLTTKYERLGLRPRQGFLAGIRRMYVRFGRFALVSLA
jgi:hypothetical protein